MRQNKSVCCYTFVQFTLTDIGINTYMHEIIFYRVNENSRCGIVLQYNYVLGIMQGVWF